MTGPLAVCPAPLQCELPDAQAMLEALPHAAWLVSLERQVVLAANALAGSLFGRPAAELCGTPAIGLATSPEDLAWWAAAAEGEHLPLDSETVLGAAGGAAPKVRRSITLLPPGPGRGAQALVTVIDLSARQRIDDEREALLADLQATLESTADGLLVTDLDGRIRAFNRRFAQMWGLPLTMLQQRDDAGIEAWMQRSVPEPAAYGERLRMLHEAVLLPATDRLTLLAGPVLERVTSPLLRNGRLAGRVWAFRDLTQRLAAEERIEALRTTDALTQLPNRRRLKDEIESALHAAAHNGAGFALLVIDLDCFRQVNDSLGHETGDVVLRQVAQRLQSCLRQDDRLARIGGDQFAVMLAGADSAAAESTARRMLNVVSQPCNVVDARFTLTCSIGIALAPSQGRVVDDLLRHAEGAMRAVKHAGRANVRLHRARAEVDRRAHMVLDHAMRQALVSGRFRLQYQPQVRLADGQLVGAEALLRWRDPELGEVAPARFIPVAEENGFIVAIGEWVLAQAVRQATLWHQRGCAVPVAVNVSALQFQQGQFVDRVASVLAVSGLPAHLLELELTESILVHEADEALHRLHALARLGVRLSIDDFGTGYSSLAYLKRFPIRKLKIDRSFVSGLPADESDAGIVRAILQMARALDMKVIAEGVETESQRQFLVREGCDEMQGFLFAPALDPLSFEQRQAQGPVSEGQSPATPNGPRVRLVRG